MFPTARAESDDLVVQEVADEFVIYDLKRHKVHSLNPTAAKVWGWCDGATSPAAMTDKVAAEFGLPADQAEPLLWLTLERLGKANLLAERVPLPASAAGLSRRRLLRMVGVATLLPVVYSMVAPTAAHAASFACRTLAQGCTGVSPSGALGTCYSTNNCTGTPKGRNSNGQNGTSATCANCFSTNTGTGHSGSSWKQNS